MRYLVVCFIAMIACGSVLSVGFAQEEPVAEEQEYLGDALLFEGKSDLDATVGQLKLPSVGEVLFKMVMFLIVVLAVVYAFLFVIQKYYKDKLPAQASGGDAVRVLSYHKLDQRKGVYLIDVLGKILVVGADYEGLRLITEIDDAEKVAEAHRLAAVKPDLFTFNPFQNVMDTFTGNDTRGKKAKSATREKKGLFQQINQLKNSLDI